ncbi:MAG: redoxin domain-containing protein [Polyangiaceae bacterium]|nr:redoxin domain-containing protein [Myxococcales bacterium]MCB9584880.1 redoxin domain-containing protein [Polyangiaceae bacterium]MCB9607547.1 redoxin domain-containing protein [Polyangiaceae bacterium]
MSHDSLSKASDPSTNTEPSDASDVEPSDAEPSDAEPSESAPVDASAGQEPRGHRRKWLSWVLQAGVVILIYFAASTWRTHSLLPTDGTVQAPPLELQTVDGQRFGLEELKGKRVQVHFWATWCTVCRQEFGALNSVYENLGSDEAMVSIVADSEDPAAIAQFVREHGIKYPVLMGNAEALRAYHIEAFPTNYYLDSQGRIRGTDVGMSTRWGMSKRIGCAR